MCVRGREYFLHACTEKTAHAAAQTDFQQKSGSILKLNTCSLSASEKKKTEPENNFIPQCFGMATARRVRRVPAIKESSKGVWLNLPPSSEHISQAAWSSPAAQHKAVASCTRPAPHFALSLQHLPLCLSSWKPHKKKEKKETSDSSSQMQIASEEPSYVRSANGRKIAFKFLTAEPTHLLFRFRRPER